MYKKIMVPLDGSKLSDCSLDHVKAVVEGRQGTEVVLISVLENILLDDVYMMTSEQKAKDYAAQQKGVGAAARKNLEDTLSKASNILAKAGISASTVVIQAEENQGVADILLDYAAKNQVDLIIMSTHGRSGISRLAFGSITSRIVHYARCAILTVTPLGCRI